MTKSAPSQTYLFVKLTADMLGEEPSEAKWVQVAEQGLYLGYLGGEAPFEFTPEIFKQLVDNFQRHPAYKAGPDGFGDQDVVPWDFNHASEMSPAFGQLAVNGSPAQGWTRDLQVRFGQDGKAQLWALTNFLEPARTYVKEGKMKWASVAVSLDAIDQITGQNVGAVLTSIALTNNPFIEGMEQLVATKNANKSTGESSGDKKQLRRFYDSAQSPEEAIRMLRELFSLSDTSGAAEVNAEIAKISQWVTTNAAPLGVDVPEILGNLRTIFNLPALSSAEEVLAHASEVIPRLLQEQVPVVSDPAPAAPAAAMVEATKTGDEEMSVELIKFLASATGVRENDEAIRAEVKELVQLRASLKNLFSLEKDAVSVLLSEAEKSISARDKLTALVNALGVEDAEGAVDRVTKLMEQAGELEKVMPELQELRKDKEQAEEAAVEADVAACMQAKGYGEEMRPMLTLYRKQQPEEFTRKFNAEPAKTPAQSAVASNPTLLANLTENNGQIVQGSPAAAAAAPVASGGGSGTINLSMYSGRNSTEQAMTYLKSQHSNWDALSHEEKCKMAFSLKKQTNVVTA